ncbi:MAG: relaxase/mobilization nuclease domain-containing protein [Gammaproteobacteria bacterium]|nr:relaxase/mobilization nuclease domain-containing protein [Gammaproteobacteria bacterium]MCP5460095.1 relaxase/mobilization nuclease domain-containing protein [Gammaproteobacteria bacterium]
MIGKKIRNPAKGAALRVRVQRLADYIDQPEQAPPNARVVAHAAKAARVEGLADYAQRPIDDDWREKCIHSGARGFQATTRAGQKAEMRALAEVSAHSKDPISHYVLSWQEGEQPTPVQIEEAVDLFLDTMGLVGHQMFYGLHADTDNVHLHLMINRVHPLTRKVVAINKGFDLEALHRAIARIEQAQGWSREEHARYRVNAAGAVQRVHHDRATHRQQTAGSPRSGTPSAEQLAREDGAPIIRAAASWAALHKQLADRGWRYERKGSGALLWIGPVAVKASRAGRDCSFTALQRRLGPFQPAPANRPTASPSAPTPSDADYWQTYRGEQATRAQAKQSALRQRHLAERQALSEAHRAQREALFQGRSWQGQGAALNAERSVLAARQAAVRATLMERQRLERAQLLERWRQGLLADADRLNRRRLSNEALAATPRKGRILKAEGSVGNDGLVAYDIRAFVAVVYSRRVDYRLRDSANGIPAFVDRGREIVITDGKNPAGVLAALQLAAQKWGTFQVEGDAEYQALCVRLAAQHGLRLGNPALQDALRQAHSTQWRSPAPVFPVRGGGPGPAA